MKIMKLAVLAAAITAICSTASANLLTTCGGSAVAYVNGTADACEVNGFAFTNFAYSGAALSNPYLQFSAQGLNGSKVNFGADNLNGNFTLDYDVILDPAVWDASLSFISSATVGLQPLGTADGVLTKTVSATVGTGGGSATWTQVGSVGTQTGGISTVATTIHVTDTFTYGSGSFLNSSNGFQETTGPEPATMFLMGGALLGLGAVARKRRNRKA